MSVRARQTKALSLRQQEVLAYIGEYLDRLGFPPTIAEMQEAFGFASPNAIQTHLRALETKGYIRRYPGRSRALEVLAPSKLISLSEAAIERRKAEGYWEATGTGPMVFRGPAPEPATLRMVPATTPQAWQGEVTPRQDKPPTESLAARGQYGRVIPFPQAGPREPSGEEKDRLPESGIYERGTEVGLHAYHSLGDEEEGQVHDHSWKVRVRIQTCSQPGQQEEMRWSSVRREVERLVLSFNDTPLNEVFPLTEMGATLGNVCALLYRRLKASLEVPGITLLSVTLWESDQNYAVYSEGRRTP